MKTREIKVGDQYRTNPLSLQPGGHLIKVVHSSGKVFVYDKVKRPGAYIKSISEENKEHGPIIQILIGDNIVWEVGCGREIWEI